MAGFIWLLFAATLLWFNQTNLYEAGFAQPGAQVVLYNIIRLFFIFAFGWLIYAPGYLLLKRWNANNHIVSFFAGVGVWTVLLLALGLAGLYQKPLMIALALGIFALSLPQLARSLFPSPLRGEGWGGGDSSATQAAPATPLLTSPPQGGRKWMLVLLAATIFIFLQVKAIYPGGWHDYFSHYFFYYREAVQTGSLAPNALWYHFFYSKGGGLYFLAMLLSDPLAPALVTASFMLMGGVMVHQLVSRFSQGIWPLAACVLYFALQIYIRGAGYGSWGQLPKFHELTAVLMLFLLWGCITLPAEKQIRKSWLIAMALAIIAAVIFTLAMAFVIGLFFALLCMYHWRVGNRERAFHMALLSAVAADSFLIICLINYLYTGVPSDYFMGAFWNHLDMEKINAWGVPFEMLSVLHERSDVSSVEWSVNLLWRLCYRFLRLDLLYTIFAVALISALIFRKKTVLISRADWPYYGIFIATTLAFAYTTGAGNPVSFYRFSSFAFAPMLCVAFYALATSKLAKPWAAWIVIVLCVAVSYSRYPKIDVVATLENAASFALGKFSIDDAYSNQRALPADAYAEGVIHPAAREVYKIVGPNTRVWAFTPYDYCLLPNCRIETHISYRMTKDPHTVFYTNAMKAKKVLQAEGLNYFLITTSLDIRDPLPDTELFSPKEIERFLQVKWTDGDSALLTWPGKDTKPISQAWLARYAKAVGASGYVTSFPFMDIKEKLEARP